MEVTGMATGTAAAGVVADIGCGVDMVVMSGDD